jgi:hypothetical protein
LVGPVIGSAFILLLPAASLPTTTIGSIQQITHAVVMVLFMIYRLGGLWAFSTERCHERRVSCSRRPVSAKLRWPQGMDDVLISG